MNSAVTTVYKGTTRKGSDVLLRSYDSRKEPPPEFNCSIWQAGRATCATGLAFKPIQIGQHVFVDEGPGTFNPSPLVLEEAAVNEWPGREVGVFVSIGTGKRPPGTNHRQHEWWEDFFGDTLGVFAEARRRLISKIEQCESVHHDMLRDHLAKRNVSQDNYFRFNVEVGVGEFGMNEWNRLADISTSTRRYLNKADVKRSILSAGIKFAKIELMNRRLAARRSAGHGAAAAPDDDIVMSPHEPPPNTVPLPDPMAVELPAELPADLPPRQPHPASSPPDDALPQHPTPQESVHVLGRYSAGGTSSYRLSSEPSRPVSQDHDSIRNSAEAFPDPYHHSNASPPPVPPKTPVMPYPEDPDDFGRFAMPVVPIPSIHTTDMTDGKVLPPYPVDEEPPLVNRRRKPTYHVQ